MKISTIYCILFPLIAFNTTFSADIKEVVINTRAELLEIVISFDDYLFYIDIGGTIQRIDLVYQPENLEDYTFWFGKVQHNNREEFRTYTRPEQNTFAKIAFNEEIKFFMYESLVSEEYKFDYSRIEHRNRERIRYYFPYKNKLSSLDKLEFTYENGDKRIRGIGGITFVYYDEIKKVPKSSRVLYSIGPYNFNTYRDLKVTCDTMAIINDKFTIRVIQVY